MENKHGAYHKYYLWAMAVLTCCFSIFLTARTYFINYWPTDSENPYLPAAANLFQLRFLSEMHNVLYQGIIKVVMHGKEALILGIAIMQRILNDYQTTFPNVFLLIIAIAVSGILLYLIMRHIFSEHIGIIAFILFFACFWPYLYMLQGAHPPFALMNFLLAIFFLQRAQSRKEFYFLSGIFLGLLPFSSPAAVMYAPYYLAFFLYQESKLHPGQKDIKQVWFCIRFIFFGFLAVFLLFTIPHPIHNTLEYLRFVNISRHSNNFAIYHNYLSQFFPVAPHLRGGGIVWIIKYFFLIMPVMFPAYLLSAAYLFFRSFKKPLIALILLVCFSTPILVEISGVVQFGRNYFSWLPGIIFLICFAIDDIFKKITDASSAPHRKILIGLIAALLLGHIISNFKAFFFEVLPSRMVTTDIYNWLIHEKNTNELFVYRRHPRYINMILFFNNPKYENKVYQWPINSIAEVKKGYILIPTVTGKTIWCECRERDFNDDPALNELLESGEFNRYVVASFPSLSSSRLWTQEEEICTYRDLIVGDITDKDRQKGFAWILDAEKLQSEWFAKKFNQNIEQTRPNRLK